MKICPFVRVRPAWVWRPMIRMGVYAGLFRNLPGVVKWIPGKVLPRRWGFYVLGVEVGERSGSATWLGAALSRHFPRFQAGLDRLHAER